MLIVMMGLAVISFLLAANALVGLAFLAVGHPGGISG